MKWLLYVKGEQGGRKACYVIRTCKFQGGLSVDHHFIQTEIRQGRLNELQFVETFMVPRGILLTLQIADFSFTLLSGWNIRFNFSPCTHLSSIVLYKERLSAEVMASQTRLQHSALSTNVHTTVHIIVLLLTPSVLYTIASSVNT